MHTGRSAYHHLLAMATTHGIGKGRVREVIEDAYISLTADEVEYHSTPAGPNPDHVGAHAATSGRL